jgi:hypothetical protein
MSLAALLFLVIASRIVLLTGLQMDPDESWSVWQTLGTPLQIIHWTPVDWPPLFYLEVGLWRGFVGLLPVALHMLTILVFMLGAALIYRVTSDLFSRQAGLIAMTAYAGLGYCIHLSTLLRGYIFTMTLSALLLWLILRYFRRPNWWRAALLALCMVMMFYTHLTSFLVFAVVGGYTLVLYRTKVLLWWRPAIIAGVLALPEVIAKFTEAGARVAANTLTTPPIGAALGSLFSDFAGTALPLWIVLFAVACALIVGRFRLRAQVLALGIWVFAPLGLYVTNPYLGFLTPRYACWVMVGAAIWLGWGLSLLPRPGRWAVVLACLGCAFLPTPTTYGLPLYQRITTIQDLSHDLKWGDVLLLDPQFQTIEPAEWDYYRDAFFPNGGLQFVTDPTGYARVWYVDEDGHQDPTTFAQIKQGRIASTFIGHPNFFIRLYEAPPNPTGIRFANGMIFHGVEIPDLAPGFPLVRRTGESIHLQFWWTTDQALPRDYSVGVYILGPDNALHSNSDSAPQVGDLPHETSRWQTGQFYIENRDLVVPEFGGRYGIYLAVYQSWDNTRFSAPTATPDNLLLIQYLDIKAW